MSDSLQELGKALAYAWREESHEALERIIAQALRAERAAALEEAAGVADCAWTRLPGNILRTSPEEIAEDIRKLKDHD